MTFAIETRHLVKHFPKTKSLSNFLLHPFRQDIVMAIQDITFQIERGEIFCLLGSNGAGKTTLLKMLCGLILPTEGVALINGLDTVSESLKVKKEIGFVVNEERSFYWRLTGRQNLMFFSLLNNMSKVDARKKIDEVLELTDLKSAAGEMFKNYSSGMKQKLAIARALLTNPKILIMDEPTRSLDPLSILKLKNFIIDLLNTKEDKTLLIATHDIKFVEEINSGSIGIIDKGKLLLNESLKNIKNGLYKETSLVDILSIKTHQAANIQ